MADIFVPGVKSRFDTDKMIESLMELERVPKTRVEQHVDQLQSQKSYWQDLGRQLSSLRDSARNLFSFQNPFNERIAVSDNTAILSASANREAAEMERFFVVKQIAQADRFMSRPLDQSYRVPAGNYVVTSGESKVSFTFRGGTTAEFVEALNTRGTGKVHARVVNTGKTEKALLIESLSTGENARLGFEKDALTLALDLGIIEPDETAAVQQASAPSAPSSPPPPEPPVEEVPQVVDAPTPEPPVSPGPPPEPVTLYIKPVSARGADGASALITEQAQGGASTASPMSSLDIPLLDGIAVTPSMMLKFETEITAPITGRHVINSLMLDDKEAAERIAQNLNVLSLVLDDGSAIPLPAISGEDGFNAQQFALAPLAKDRTAAFLRINNTNVAREVSLRNIQLFDPTPEPAALPAPAVPVAEAAPPAPEVADSPPETPPESPAAPPEVPAAAAYKPRAPVSRAQNAVVEMDGIEITRPTNTIDDLLPGVTLSARAPSELPVRVGVEPDRESVKESLITLVGNYNRLVAEINVLTRSDPAVINELTYLTADEQEALRKKSGAFAGDSSLAQMRSALFGVFTSPYQLADGRAILVSELGIGSDVQRRGGYDPSKLRGYMEIDEKALDAAIAARITDLQALFGRDTDGDLIIDSGLAFNLERVARPYVETGGIISLKTGSLDSRIQQDTTRLQTIDRQLAQKEQSLKNQYGAMEGAYNRMERMSESLSNFGRQNSGQ